MKSVAAVAAVLATTFICASAQAQNLCAKYPVVVSDLSACSTATAFCSSYLKGTVTYTKTFTHTKTAKRTRITTITTTTGSTTITDPSNTVTVTADTSTFSTDTTTTITTTADTCTDDPTVSVIDKLRRYIAANTASCNIYKTAPAAAISGGCECYLGSSKTVFVTEPGKTRTVHKTHTHGTQTSTYTDTTTTTPTTTVFTTTSTVTACTTTPTGCADLSEGYSCGGDLADAPCDVGPFGDCFCAETAEGTVACAADDYCSNPTCSTSEDCAAQGYDYCVVNTCCDEPVCVYAGNSCPNDTSPSRIFKNPGGSRKKKTMLGSK